MYDADAFAHSYGKHVEMGEDLCMRQSILLRAQRRRASAKVVDEAVVAELLKKESDTVVDAYSFTEWPLPHERYEEWECHIYTYVQHLLDGYYGGAFDGGFGAPTENLRFPSAAAYNNWAYGFLKSGFPSDALGMLLRALEFDFNCSYVWHTLSETYQELGRKDKAEWALTEYHKLVQGS